MTAAPIASLIGTPRNSCPSNRSRSRPRELSIRCCGSVGPRWDWTWPLDFVKLGREKSLSRDAWPLRDACRRPPPCSELHLLHFRCVQNFSHRCQSSVGSLHLVAIDFPSLRWVLVRSPGSRSCRQGRQQAGIAPPSNNSTPALAPSSIPFLSIWQTIQ